MAGKVLVVGVFGPSGCGANSVSKRIFDSTKCSVVEFDPYLNDLPAPEATDIRKFVEDAKKAISTAATHAGQDGVTRIVLLKGVMLCFWEEIAKLCHERIFLDCSEILCSLRRRGHLYKKDDEFEAYSKKLWNHFNLHLPTQLENAKKAGGFSVIDAQKSEDDVFVAAISQVMKAFEELNRADQKHGGMQVEAKRSFAEGEEEKGVGKKEKEEGGAQDSLDSKQKNGESAMQWFMRSRLASKLKAASGKKGDKVFLVLGGSFNPVHRGHVENIDHAVAHLQTKGITVVAAVLVPANDTWVRHKFSKDEQHWALSEAKRIHLCELACQHSEFAVVLPWAECSAQSIGVALVQATGFRYLMVCGADMIARGCYLDSASVCFARDGLDMRQGIEMRKNRRAETHVIETETLLKHLSSTLVREFMKRKDWDGLKSSGILHDNVLKALTS